MKTVSLLPVLMIAVFLIGCENPELVTCQEEKGILQGQLEQANAAVTEKENQIAALKAKNTEMQTKAMESITAMMTKQAEKDQELKAKLVQSQQQVKKLTQKVTQLEKQIAEHKCAVPAAGACCAEKAVEETN